MLGSSGEADDAVQEAWIRLSRADVGSIQNLGGWLTTVVSRVCLDLLHTRRARKEEEFLSNGSAPHTSRSDKHDPERDALLADALGSALLVVLDTLPPADRVAFVLHDMFDLSYGEIAAIVGRSE